jgi:hypothetical protein
MKKLNFLTILFTALVLVFNACNKDTEIDTQAPEIAMVSPDDEQYFHPGDTIHFEAGFSDDVALSQFKIEIHYGSDHTHKSDSSQEVEWSFEHIGDLSGREQLVTMDIEIPENAEHGEYHFLVYCTDLAGNESWIGLDIFIDEEGHNDPH